VARIQDEESPKTKEQLMQELGWIVEPPQPAERLGPLDGPAETTISPRFVKTPEPRSHLKYLRNPEQPTAISAQIDGIPKTEADIHTLANELRIQQRMQGRTKTKLAAPAEGPQVDEWSGDILEQLTEINYLDDDDARRIKGKFAPSVSKPPQTRRTKSAERAKRPASGQRFMGRGRD
jgi:hypothetical protein